MLLTSHLDVEVFVVVFVERGGGETVAEPEVYSFWCFAEGNAGEGNVGWHILKERGILVAEVVIFWGVSTSYLISEK